MRFGLLVAVLAWAVGAQAQPAPVQYRVTFPAPEHHWLEVDVTFPALGQAPLRARMSRSSPGRYAVHEFAKNVFQVSAFDGAGRALTLTRPDVDEWRVDGHDGGVRLVYRIFGDHADGTYLAVDTTHAHLNMPATFMWAVGLDDRPIDVTFVPPPRSGWAVGTQLMPTADPFRFTAPNLQYFMDSPTELARLLESTFTVAEADGRQVAFRLLAHTDATKADLDALATLVERLVREQRAVFGAFPVFEPGHYTFLLDYVAWADSDAMEHRNSTYISDPGATIRTPAGRQDALDAMSHEFFHVWNVERIRPTGLEPFDFTRENVTCCLWLAEGFTQYYGPLLLQRAGLSGPMPMTPVVAAMTHPGRLVRSAVQMSEHGPFADAGVANDAHDRSRTFLSYYTYGAAIALGLDLTIRDRTNGAASLDDFMRRLWQRYGAETNGRPGYVARPYTLADLRQELGDLLGDAAYAATFFDRHIDGREVIDYPTLLARAGFVVERLTPTRGWIGTTVVDEDGRGLMVRGLAPFDTPIYRAGVDRGDRIVTIDDGPATLASWRAIGQRTPGTPVRLTVERRDGTRETTEVVAGADPSVHVIPAETTGVVTAAQRAFRETWLGSRVR